MKKGIKLLPPYEVLDHLFYVTDGVLYWSNPKTKIVKVGDRAGCVSDRGYLVTRIKGKSYLNHRIIWKIVNKAEPMGQIDHVDGNPLNNQIKNLRLASNQENSKNQSMPKNNTSGTVGVSWCRQTNKWRAQISINGKCTRLGQFADKKEAITNI